MANVTAYCDGASDILTRTECNSVKWVENSTNSSYCDGAPAIKNKTICNNVKWITFGRACRENIPSVDDVWVPGFCRGNELLNETECLKKEDIAQNSCNSNINVSWVSGHCGAFNNSYPLQNPGTQTSSTL